MGFSSFNQSDYIHYTMIQKNTTLHALRGHVTNYLGLLVNRNHKDVFIYLSLFNYAVRDFHMFMNMAGYD